MSPAPIVHNDRRHLRVLVADADRDTRDLYRLSFGHAGCDVVEAADGREALATALVHPPSLVVMELRLRFIDGFALCHILRRDPQTAHVPILVVTTETRPVALNRARGIGADGVLVKPATPDIIVSQAQELWARSDRLRARADPAHVVADDVIDRSQVTPARSAVMTRTSLVKAHLREMTTTPSHMPPILHCTSCDRVLTYRCSQLGGVSEKHPEQWDYLTCAACGAFQYRQRTRKLRRLDIDDAQWIEVMLRRTADE